MNVEQEFNIDHIIFLSSDESEEEINLDNHSINATITATTGFNISNTNSMDIMKHTKNIIHNNSNNSVSDNSSSDDNIVNGWNDDAINTINNWYNLFKQQSFIYQWLLDRNNKISNKLMITSIVASSALGIFSSFKLWVKGDTFKTVSDVLLMLSNFSVALITGYSKSYLDDKRNELIKIYIEEVDELLGEISGQILKSPIYRVNAVDFFKDHNYKYNKLITYVPNMSIYELNESMKEYKIFKEHLFQ
jgi:hypothetical protein